MIILEDTKQKIQEEYEEWETVQYAGKSLEERKVKGQFFTPPLFTFNLLEKLSDLNGIVLDPACGAGGLIAASIIAGADPKKCYGMELDENLVDIAKERLGKLGVPDGNITKGDATKTIPVRADRVIMNPPYGTLYLPILKNVIENMGDSEWEITALQPYTWIELALCEYESAAYKKYGASIQPHIVSIDKIDAIDGTANFDAFFFASIGVYYLKSSGGQFDLMTFAKEQQEKFPAMFKCLLDCYQGRIKTLKDACETEHRGEFVKISLIHGNPNKKDFYDLISPEWKYTRNKEGKSVLATRYMNFDTDEEAENFRKSLTNNAFYKLLSSLYKFDQNVRLSRYPWLGEKTNPRTGLVGYKGEWTDEDLFVLYNVGEEEAKKVKESMKKHLWKTI